MKSHSQRSFNSFHGPDGERSRVHLPQISGTRVSTEEAEVYDNPFYVPPDEEIFMLKNKEKEIKEADRRRAHSLKIWEKGIKHTSEGKLRRILELTNYEDEDGEEDNEDKLNIVEAARSAIKNRVRHTEPLMNFLNKKREMFLFQMTINEKKEQIKEFEELAHLQEISLQNSKDLLEKDADTFKMYVERNKNDTRKAIKKAEEETKEKQKRIQEVKHIQEKLSTLMSQNTKQLERLQKLYAYKVFFDKLTPEEFSKKVEQPKSDQKSIQSITGDVRKSIDKNRVEWQMYNTNLSPGVVELLNDDDEQFEMYFKKPEQLQVIFEDLEEQNLFTIKYTQEIEQSLEDLKRNCAIKKAELLEKANQLKKNKHELEKTIQTRLKSIDQLHNVKDDAITEKIYSRLENAIKTIFEKSKLLRDGKSEQQINGYEILKTIERKLDVQLKDLKHLPFQRVFDQYKVCVARRREEVNEQKRQAREEEQKLKMEILKKRMLAEKRYGRPIMAKSMLQAEKKEDSEPDEIDEDEIDRQLYFTERFQ